MNRSRHSVVVFLVVALLLSACSQPLRPDLRRLYEEKSGEDFQPPVIVIHGALGSRLGQPDQGIEAWPGNFWRLLFGNYRVLELDIDSDLLEPKPSVYKATQINREVLQRDYYGRIMRVLDDVGGYRLTEPGTPARPGERRCYVFAYDWRQDVVDSARQLDELIDTIRRDFGVPDMQVDVVAHSLGGLIARYYVRYGVRDVISDCETPIAGNANPAVRRLVLLGVPNFGAVKTVRTLDQGHKIGFGTVPPETTITFPSMYQLLPHPLTAKIFNADGRLLEHDLYDVAFWSDHRLSIFNPETRQRIRGEFADAQAAARHMSTLEAYFAKHLERGRRFALSLSTRLRETGVNPVVFGGDCIRTPANLVLESRGTRHFLRIEPNEIEAPRRNVDYGQLMLNAGDGTVTKASLLARQTANPTVRRHESSYFPMHHAVFLCHEHAQLTGNIHFQDNLLNTLLSVDQPAPPERHSNSPRVSTNEL